MARVDGATSEVGDVWPEVSFDLNIVLQDGGLYICKESKTAW
jgi:hypothetical protein